MTRVGGDASYLLGGRTSILVTAANLLNHQTGEPDNVTVVPGRTVNLGLRRTF